MNGHHCISQWCLGAAILVLALCVPVPAFAASTVAVSGAGDGVFLVQGIGVENSSAIDITIGYDTATLGNPRVVAGPLVAGAMSAINTNVPGKVHMVMVSLSPVKGSGVIATMSFDRRGTSPGSILSVSAKLANSQGAPLAVQTRIQNPADVQTADAASSQTTESPAETAGVTGAVVAAGTAQTSAPKIIIAGPSERAGDKASPDAQAAPEGTEQPAPPGPGSAPQDEKTAMAQPETAPDNGISSAGTSTAAAHVLYAQESVIDRFQQFKGKRTSEACIALFEQAGRAGCKQDPPVAISDGKTAVRVTFLSTSGKKTASDVALMGAKLVSLKQSPAVANTWVAEVIPEKGEYRASMAISQGDVTMVCPLTIAPKAASGTSRSLTITKSDLDRYFTERNSTKGTKGDVNKDGKRDYLDDYIITANYLAAMPQKHR